jgi:uncharacterized protein (TIGR02996 family)
MPRSHADAFLEAILQNPNDDTPRLVYADWLDEQGDPPSAARAEFIRIQCVLANGYLPTRRRADLERRQQEFLEQYRNEWAQSIRRLVRTWDFHRGFIDEVELFASRFLSYAGRLFRQAPIQHVRLWREIAPPASRRLNVPALADSEYLRRLRSLDLSDNRLETRDLRALVVSEHLTNLTALNLAHNRIGDGGIRALAESPLLGQLTHLDLRHNDFGPAGVRALARALVILAHSPEGLRLQRMNLRGNNLGTAGWRLLADSPLLQRITRR